jgi:chemotaxis protein MotB
MRKITTTAICLLLAGFSLTSCVSKRKYVAARTRGTQEHADNMVLNSRLTRLEDSLNVLHHRVGALGNANQNVNNELNKTNDALNRTSSELNMSKDQVIAQRARMAQLQAFIDQQQKAVGTLKEKIAAALVGFNSNELTVTMKDGRVYISMQEALLFPSGSASVNPRGKEALAKVAGVLNTNSDVNIDIEGHTDNKPIHTTQFPDNWALSTARATSIAHVLIDDYKVVPAKLIASGRSSYVPVATNESPEGRAQNRRTEIILEPKLDELMQMMNGSVNTAAK